MEEQNHNGVGSSCPICGVPVAPNEVSSHTCDTSNIEETGGNHENMPPPSVGGEENNPSSAPLPSMNEESHVPTEEKDPEMPPSHGI